MDVLTLKGLGPRDRGRAHGEHFRSRIHEIARIRVDLALAQGKLGSEAALLEVCRKHLPVLAAFDHALHDELLGIAEGADLDPTRVVCLNHYTDLKDIADEECTSAAAMTPDGPVFGQTWDMHGSVEPYVCVLELDGLNAFSITGCLALAGLNDAGLGVCINNLKSHDARVGEHRVDRALALGSAAGPGQRALPLVSEVDREQLVARGGQQRRVATSARREELAPLQPRRAIRLTRAELRDLCSLRLAERGDPGLRAAEVDLEHPLVGRGQDHPAVEAHLLER